MPPVTSCAFCECLGSVYVARTGSGEQFPAAYDGLKKGGYNLQSDLLRCPSCDAIFLWEDNAQLFGSGNLDDETLTRLDEPQAQVVRDLLGLPDRALSAGELLVRTFTLLPETVRGLVLRHLRNAGKEAFAQLLPALLDRLHEANDSALRTFLTSYCYDGTIRCAQVLKMLEENPRPKNGECEELAKYCRKSMGL